MSTITVTLADDDLAFLRRFSKTQGTSAEEMIARQARNLRQKLEQPLPATIVSASGIFSEDEDPSRAYHDHLERKHR